MLDTTAEAKPDRRPAIVICAYEVDDDGWDPIEDLSGHPWSPTGARTIAVAASDPEGLAETLASHLRDTDCRAMLLVGRNRRSDLFRIQMRAENRGATPGAAPLEQGPSIARATAPAAEMVRALNDVGLAADATSDGEEDVGSYLLYRVLNAMPEGVDVPSVGLLRVPEDSGPDAVGRGVKAAAGAIARHLSPLPRARHV